MLQVLHAQRAARHLVLVGRADALARGADLAVAALLALRLARLVDRHVERHDQRAGLADEQARAHVQADLFQALDLGQQVGRIDHHAVADVAVDAVAHHARRDQLQRGLDALDDQRVARVVAALEADDALRVVGQPVDDLALAFVAPLGADDDDVAAARDGWWCCLVAWGRDSGRRGSSADGGRPVMRAAAGGSGAARGCAASIGRRRRPARGRRRIPASRGRGPGKAHTTVSLSARSARMAARRPASSLHGARMAARSGAAGIAADSWRRSRLKPTAGRLRPNTAPTSS